jgi:transposase
MKKLFIGIDVSRDVFDYCVLKDNREVLTKGVEQNSKKGIQQFIDLITAYKDHDSWLCMEHTGHYGALLSTMFSNQKVCFSVVNPLEIKNSIGITRGKNDAVDAYRIATYACSNNHKLQVYNMPNQEIQKLKAMMTIRDGYVKINVQLKNSLKALLILSETVDIKEQIKQQKLMINRQEKAVKQVESQMKEVISENLDLKNTFEKITSVIGVGPLTAIKCISETENFIKFTEGRKFSCHCGLAPFEYQSGSSVRGKTKTSPLSKKALKAILFKAALTAINHDPQLRNYYQRKLKEGKHKLSVINAVANKIVLRIFAVVKRDEPYVKLAA